MAERTSETTHKIMSAIKQKDTEPEVLLRKALWQAGLRYRKNYRGLPGKPDIVFSKAKLVVFCDGDFWHGHNWAVRGLPSFEVELASYSSFWKEKLLHNIARDKQVTEALTNAGWTVLRFWESDIRSNVNKCVEIIESNINKE